MGIWITFLALEHLENCTNSAERTDEISPEESKAWTDQSTTLYLAMYRRGPTSPRLIS